MDLISADSLRMETKHCADCGEARPVSEFGPCRRRKDGLQFYCKKHNRLRANAYRRVHYAQDPKKYLDRVKNWRKANPARAKAAERRGRVKHLYGLTPDAYEALKRNAGGHCQICKRRAKLHVDHDHKTKKVRGMLCMHCNHALGKFKDSTKLLQAAIAYLLSK